jgi:hypothetical protein
MSLSKLIESVRLNQELWDTDEIAMLEIYDALLKAELLESKNRNLSFELAGVITDVEYGNGFDNVCLETVKRVKQGLKE